LPTPWSRCWRAQGMSVRAIGQEVAMHYNQVAKWRRRFIKGGLGELQDQPRSGRKGSIGPKLLRKIVDQATRPPQGRARWTCRAMANALGVSKATVQRVWSDNEIKPHLTRVFKLSTDPDFETKFWDVIGLYLNPPEKAVVLCCDEKSQIQALQRSQPGLPPGKGHIRTETHDYYRNGTVTLFAALDYLQGKVIAYTVQTHTHRRWLEFLKQIDCEIPLNQHKTLVAIAHEYLGIVCVISLPESPISALFRSARFSTPSSFFRQFQYRDFIGGNDAHLF
jgi:Homeodomain-like domain